MSTSSTLAVQLSQLTKRFGDHVAVDAIDLTVTAGMFYGIVGPNGAGKSTMLSMIAGRLAPDSGTSPSAASTPRVRARKCSVRSAS